MKKITQSNTFKKDYKRDLKRGKKQEKFTEIVALLASGKELPARCRPHKLTGNFDGFWECHIEPDWLLIYDFGDDFLYLSRLGTHSDLFK